MEWHSSRPSFAPPSAEASFNFLFNCNLEPFPPSGMDAKQAEMMMMMGSLGGGGGGGGGYGDVGCSLMTMGEDKKKRLTCEQLESLEKSFQEEIKLDPERKMKLSRELALQPRQVAVWFQNRRARWKAKQLERLYDSLRLEFDAVSREKQKLQDEVMKLRAMLIDVQATTRNNHNNINTKQVSIGFTEVSGGDETVESTSAATMRGGGGAVAVAAQPQQQPHSDAAAGCQNYMFSGIDDYNTTVASPPLPPYWAVLPAYPPC
ncbi:hypothetical protein V2J09_010650 [Rumex salicifolius]